MNNLTVVLLVCLLTICNGDYRVISLRRSIGATKSPHGKFPYVAKIVDRAGYMCGGSIIHKKYILTAAHCVFESTPCQLDVVVGTNDFNGKGGDRYTVKNIIVHEDHERMPEIYSRNDLAILELNEEIKLNDRVKLVKLPNEPYVEVIAETKVLLAGFGSTSIRPLKFPKTMQFLMNEILDHGKCAYSWMRLKAVPIDDTQICTKVSPGLGVCVGDSGSALINKDGVQVGISSFGIPCAKGLPDVYTNVLYYLDWINEKISH